MDGECPSKELQALPSKAKHGDLHSSPCTAIIKQNDLEAHNLANQVQRGTPQQE